MGKCKYCGTKIHEGDIRCFKCDNAWQDGYEAGMEEIKARLREIFRVLKNLAREDSRED